MADVADVILRIRDTVGDAGGDRWNDDRLIRSINDAQMAICERANILRKKIAIAINGGVSTYNLPSDSLLVTRIAFEGVNIPFKSHEEMDAFSSTWEEDTGDTPIYIVYDKLNRGVIRLYPTPTIDIPTDTTSVPDYGLITITSSTGITVADDFGVLSTIFDIKDDLVAYYTKKPIVVTAVSEDLELNEVWHRAIKYYVCGNLLRDDKDTQNRAMGNEELQLYVGELMEAMENSSRDFTQNTQYQSDYRRT